LRQGGKMKTGNDLEGSRYVLAFKWSNREKCPVS